MNIAIKIYGERDVRLFCAMIIELAGDDALASLPKNLIGDWNVSIDDGEVSMVDLNEIPIPMSEVFHRWRKSSCSKLSSPQTTIG